MDRDVIRYHSVFGDQANTPPCICEARKDEFVNKVLETAQNSLESTVFESIAAELDSMNAKYPAFDGWTVFAEGVIEGAGENFLDRTGSQG